MATSGNLEVLVLRRNGSLICEMIVNCVGVVWFANRITEEMFLTTQAKSSIIHTAGISDLEKCSRLISAVETQVKVDSSKYLKFINILQEEPVMQSVVTTLSESYSMLCSVLLFHKISVDLLTPNLGSPSSITCDILILN